MKITERQWLTAESPSAISDAVRKRQNARKMRLFGSACCRRLGDLLADPRSWDAIGVAEQFADGEVKVKSLTAARSAAQAAVNDLGQPKYRWEADGWAAIAVEMLVWGTAKVYFQLSANRAAEAIGQSGVRTNAGESAIQVGLLRDIFGNPFRPAAFDPAWRTSTVAAIARQMYESRDFGAMPILADALQDAGCENAELLDHCLGPGPHVRGCWVVDLVLGKS
jgi:hypothetical protein